MKNDYSTKKTEAVVEVEKKPINDGIIRINNVIRILYSNLMELENRLYPILEDDREEIDVAEEKKEPDKLCGKLNNIEIDISKINHRITELLRLLMIDRFDV